MPGFPAVTSLPVLLGDTSQQDTTDITAGNVKLNYSTNGNNRFEGVYRTAAVRQTEPWRVVNQHAGLGEQRVRLLQRRADCVEQRVVQPHFVDTKLSYNNTHFPLSQKTTLQPLTDSAQSNTLLRNLNSTNVMFRRRLEFVSNLHIYVPNMLGGRHEFKVGIDNGYTPEDVDTFRVDDVNLAYSSADRERHLVHDLQLAAAPRARGHEHGALRSGLYAIGRLTVTAECGGNGSRATCPRR